MAEKKYIIDNPDLMAEWDLEKNKEVGLDPSKLTISSQQKAWWKCALNHSWDAAIASRTYKKYGCPFCSGNKVLKGVNDFKTLNPKLADFFDAKNDFDLSTVSASSGKKAWWICQNCKTSFSKRISDIVRPLCKSCSNTNAFKKIQSTSSFAYLFPELLKEWDFSKNVLDPYNIKPRNNDTVFWICKKCGSSFETTPDYRVRSNGGGCKKCKSNTLSSVQRAPKSGIYFIEKHPDIIDTYYDYDKNDIKLATVSYKSNRIAIWRCKKCGTSWESKFQDMAEGRCCPSCEAIKFRSFPEQCLYYYVSKYFKSAVWSDHTFKNYGLYELDIYIPDLEVAIEYDGEHWHQDVEQDFKKDTLCQDLGIKLIRLREPSCPDYTSNSIKIYRTKNHQGDNYNDLEKSICSVLNEIDNSITYEVNVEVDLTDIYAITPNKWVPVSFAEKYPSLAKHWDTSTNGNIAPTQISSTSSCKFGFLCELCGKSFKRSITTIIRNSRALCNPCSRKEQGRNRSIASVETSIGYKYPELAKELINQKNEGIDVYSIYPNSCNKYWWKCSKCEHLYLMSPNNRISGHGCKKCGILSRAAKRSKMVKNKKTGEVFKSLTDASIAYKVDVSCICACCNGRQKTAAGCQWEYAKDI